MLAVETFVCSRYDSRAYVVSQPGFRKALVIDACDPSMEAPTRFLESRGMRVGAVVLTHEHYDHIAGVNILKEQQRCQLICSRECAGRSADPKRNFSRYLAGHDFACAAADATCEDLDWSLRWNGLEVRFIATPGHSPGSICIAVGPNLFTGDTLIRDTRTVTKLPGGDKRALEASIKSILRAFPGDTRVHPGHGEGFFLREVEIETVLKKRA